jgi:hypothetical protein
LRRKELLTPRNQENIIEVRYMFEEIFYIILDRSEGDYILKVQLLAVLKPAGWSEVILIF